MDSQTIQVFSYPVLYLSPTCDGQAYAVVENNPVPLFRLLQRMNSTDSMAFYPGNPVTVQSFQGYSATGDPARDCLSTLISGWDAPLAAGPLATFDVSNFPGPFTVR